MLSTQRSHKVGCSALLPRVELRCQQRSHFSSSTTVICIRRSGRSVLIASESAALKGINVAEEVINTNRNSSPNACKLSFNSAEQYSVTAASSEPRSAPAARCDSMALFTAVRTKINCCQKSSPIASSAESFCKSSLHSASITDGPRSPGRFSQISSAVKLSMGAIQRTSASPIWYIAV